MGKTTYAGAVMTRRVGAPDWWVRYATAKTAAEHAETAVIPVSEISLP